MEYDGGVAEGEALFHHIWKEKERSPLDYQLRVLESVEPFCLHHKIPFVAFVRDRVFRLQKGTFLSAKGSLVLVGSFLFQIVRTRDLYRTILELVEPSGEQFAPEVLTRLVHSRSVGEASEGWLIHRHGRNATLPMQGYDADTWLGIQLEMVPERIGAPGFHAADCLCEVREIPRILELSPRSMRPVWNEDGWFSEGRRVSRSSSFHQWLRSQELGIDDFSIIDDHPIQIATEDFTCPVRGRRILREGAAYGAQGYVMRVRWGANREFSIEEGITRLIRSAMGEDPDPIEQASHRHEELLRRFQQKLRFIFHRQDETMSCNGEHLLRGVPAKILQKILMAHTLTSRTSFEHREFRRDPDLGLDPLNPNLEGRIRILADRLEERTPGVKIVKSGRGRFDLETTILVEFTEE